MNNKVYKKLTDIEHVLHRPDTYIGSTVNTESYEYVLDGNNENFIEENLTWNPALYKMFDEVISNSLDESKRNKKLNKINVSIDKEKISIFDNGGIEIKKLPEYNDIYLPEMIFSELRTSSNYDDSEKRNVIGTNGLGCKLTSIFSKVFTIHICDGKLDYKQEFSDNLHKKSKPYVTIHDGKKVGFTEITFKPDLERFNLTEITDDNIKIIHKRVIDLAGTNPNITFTFNGKTYKFKSFEEYCNLYGLNSDDFFYDESETWQIGIHPSDNGFKQISFSNGVHTKMGGTHVEYIFDQIVNYIRPYIEKKNKISLKPSDIRNQMVLFVNATIINNRFTSQTKEKLSTDSKNFGTEYVVPESLLKKIAKSEIVNRILDWKKQKDEITEKIELRKLHKNLSNIKVPNLIDCNSKIRRDCDIYLFEGISAQSAGLKFRNPKTQAFYTLRGKVLNVNKLSNIKILQNNELKGLISSLGLELTNEKIDDLRYGRILISTDYDVDGHSICGLIINFLALYWKQLFENERVFRVITPLMTLESKTGKNRITLYSEAEYNKFVLDNDIKGYNIQYKKGLSALNDVDIKNMLEKPKLLKITLDDKYSESLENWYGNDTEMRKKILTDKI